jgi:hypothetical protein
MWCAHSVVALVVSCYCGTTAPLIGCLHLRSANAISASVWCKSSACGCRNSQCCYGRGAVFRDAFISFVDALLMSSFKDLTPSAMRIDVFDIYLSLS